MRMWTTRSPQFDRLAWLFVGGLLSAILVLQSTAPGQAAGFSLDHWKQHNGASTVIVDHSKWAEILDAYLVAGDGSLNRFRYGSATEGDKQKLKDCKNLL